MDFDQLADEAFGRIQAAEREAALAVDLNGIPPPASGSTIVVYASGVPQSGTLAGTANEISVTQVGTTLTVAFAAAFILKGINTAAGLRTAAGLGTIATTNIVAASANTAANPGAGYVQAEAQAVLDELRDLKTKMRTAGVLAT